METYFPIPSNQSQLARERVVADLHNLVADTELLLEATAGDLSESAREARRRVGAAIARTRANLNAWQQKGVESARYMAQRGDEIVRDHPYETIATALAIGAVVGFLAFHSYNHRERA